VIGRYVWYGIGAFGLVLATILLFVLRDRSRARDDAGLTAEELRKKKALEDMADNLSP